MKRYTLSFALILMSSFGLLMAAPQTAAAIDKSCPTFMVFKAWYCGLADSNGDIGPVTTDGSSGTKLSVFIWTIVANVIDDVFRLVGLVAAGYIIWGGYQYMLARGDSSKIANAKNTIMRAITGLIIAILASAIVNVFMRVILG
jgi:hypothetical protein